MTQHNSAKHIPKHSMTLCIMKLSIMTLGIMSLSIISLNITAT
jgi:hypothetical protein